MDKNDAVLSFGVVGETDKAEKLFALPRDKQARLLRSVHETSGKEMDAFPDDLSAQG